MIGLKFMINKKIKKCINRIFPKENVKNINKLKIGSFKNWDSLAHLNLLLIIEKEFKIKFPIKLIYEIKTIKEIVFFINNNKKKNAKNKFL